MSKKFLQTITFAGLSLAILTTQTVAVNPPHGSYQKSCTQMSVNGQNVLSAICNGKTECSNGSCHPKEAWTYLNLNSCKPRQDISNCNGTLKCGGC